MNYRLDKYGNRISALGYGCMRFQKTMGRIELEKAEQQIMAAYRAGVNYYDTAYIYPGSEAALGEILEKNGIREQVFIATKLPHYLIRSMESLEKLFNEQLSRLRTDHIDYFILVLTSEYEGFGLVVAEAMSHGVVPVVYNSFESAKDLITDGYNGALIEKPFSVSRFTKVVQELMENTEWLVLSQNSRIASKRFSVNTIVKDWYQLWNN